MCMFAHAHTCTHTYMHIHHTNTYTHDTNTHKAPQHTHMCNPLHKHKTPTNTCKSTYKHKYKDTTHTHAGTHTYTIYLPTHRHALLMMCNTVCQSDKDSGPLSDFAGTKLRDHTTATDVCVQNLVVRFRPLSHVTVWVAVLWPTMTL